MGSLIEKTEIAKKTPLLFDNKRVNFLLLKESIKIKHSCNQKNLTKKQVALLVDIKESVFNFKSFLLIQPPSIW